ncbi:MAG: hypothetical protein ACI9ES_002750 [Oceanospirillaceae bacterium]|jgi:hypothetical protein
MSEDDINYSDWVVNGFCIANQIKGHFIFQSRVMQSSVDKNKSVFERIVTPFAQW